MEQREEKHNAQNNEIEALSSGTGANEAGDDVAREKVGESSSGESRRRFLQRGAMAGGGLVLGLTSRSAIAAEPDKTQSGPSQSDKAPGEVVLKLQENKELSNVGGSRIVETRDDKIIVARVEEAKFVACSAICTHKGCQVVYEHSSKQFVCPCHKARYGLDGQVLRGPARLPLKSYATDTAAVIALKKK
jgi:cytochrome b6-f complex iron-sulfur subunit